MPTELGKVGIIKNICPAMNRICGFWYANKNEENAACNHPQKDSPKLFCKRISNLNGGK